MTVGVEFPAVVDAANAVLLVATEEQACATVRTEIGDQGRPAARIAKTDQLFTEQHHALRVAVGGR